MNDDIAKELYKLEYEKAAERYENIYKAVWANFSYLTVVAGGIYAFGSRLFSWEWTVVLAVSPLFFWWFAIFEPMNRYGDRVLERLKDIETILNKAYRQDLIGSLQASPPDEEPDTGYGLRHYTMFARRERAATAGSPPGGVEPEGGGFFRRPRTRNWIRTVIPSLFGLALVHAILSGVGVIPPTLLSKDDTVIIDRPDKLDGRIAGVDMQALTDAAAKDPKIKEDFDKFKAALSVLSNDVRTLNRR